MNFQQIPVNCPYRARTYTRDGRSAINNQGGAPNYHPNSFNGPVSDERTLALSPIIPVVGDAKRYDSSDDDNYSHPRALYQRVLTPEKRKILIDNLVTNLQYAAELIQERAIYNFTEVDHEFGRRVREGLRNLQRPHADL